MAVIPVGLIGGAARRALAGPGPWRARAVFPRTVYWEAADGSLSCLGPPGLGGGPLNALADLPADWRWTGRLVAGDPARRVGDQLLAAGPLTISLAGARSWVPRRPPAGWTPATLAANLGTLAGAAARRSLPGGLAPLVPALAGPWREPPAWRADSRLADSPLLAAAARGVGALQRWLATAMGDDGDRPAAAPGPPPAVVTELVGLGPGLTPSGDDLLGGVMVALHALGAPGVAAALAAAVLPAAARATHAISLAHLRCAAGGEGMAAVHDLLAALCTPAGAGPATGASLPGDASGPAGDSLLAGAEALAATGHTSGWDALAGVALAARAVVDAAVEVA